jgi:hypothetical protein
MNAAALLLCSILRAVQMMASPRFVPAVRPVAFYGLRTARPTLLCQVPAAGRGARPAVASPLRQSLLAARSSSAPLPPRKERAAGGRGPADSRGPAGGQGAYVAAALRAVLAELDERATRDIDERSDPAGAYVGASRRVVDSAAGVLGAVELEYVMPDGCGFIVPRRLDEGGVRRALAPLAADPYIARVGGFDVEVRAAGASAPAGGASAGGALAGGALAGDALAGGGGGALVVRLGPPPPAGWP